MAFDRSKVLAAAQKQLAKGNYERAIAEYRKLVERDPNDLRTWLKIGDLYARTNKARMAVQAYQRVASRYAEQGFHLKAVAVYKQILKLEPDREDVEMALAQAYEELQLASDAIRTYERVAARFQQRGRTDEALDVLRRIADLEPDDVAARIKYAEALSRAGRREQAAEQFEEAARLLLEEGREEDYLKVAERLLYHRPNDADLAGDLARRYLKLRDPKRALAKLQICFKANPRDPRTLGALAEAFEQLGQGGKAVSVLRELARIHREAGQGADEASVLERILARMPDDEEARRRLAALRPAKPAPAERADEARAAPGAPSLTFDDATDVELVDEDEVVVVEEVDEEDLAEIEEVVASERPSVDAQQAEIARLLSECDVFARYGLHERVVTSLQKVIELDPDDIPARERLKDAFLALGRVPEAVEQLHALADIMGRTKPTLARLYLRQVLDISPADARAREALGLPAAETPSESGARPASGLRSEDGGSAAEPPPPASAGSTTDDVVLFEDDGASEPAGPPAASAEDEVPDPAVVPPLATIEDGVSEPPTRLEPVGGVATESEPPAAFETESAEVSEEEAARAEAEALERTSMPPGDIEEALDEAEFFLAQGLLKEARATLEEALATHPGHPLLLDRLRELDEGESAATGVDASEDAAFELAEKLAEELDDSTDAFLEAEDGELDAAIDFDRFKKEVEQTVGADDVDTHFDLGIAYKEMGLVDAAIDEFELCSRSPEREAAARAMLGLCYLERGEVSEAIAQFKKGLYAEQKTPEEELGLYYELGNAYEALGDVSEALYYFEKVAKREATFRDVADRVERLRGGGAGEGVAIVDASRPEPSPFGDVR